MNSLVRLIDEHGPWSIFWWALVVVSTIGGIISLADGVPAWVLILAVVLVAGVILIAVLDTSRRREQQRNAMLRGALTNLRRYVAGLDHVHRHTKLWRDEIAVSKRGHTHWHSTLTVYVEPTSPSSLHFLEWNQGGEALSPRERQRLEITCRAMPGGGRIPVEEVEWRGGEEVSLVIHFLEPVPPGQEISVQIDFAWPHTLPGLWRDYSVERLEWTPNRLTKEFQFLVSLEASYPGKKPLGINTSSGFPHPTQRQQGDSWIIEGGVANAPQDKLMWIELDPRGPGGD
jgi:hypothetical protein